MIETWIVGIAILGGLWLLAFCFFGFLGIIDGADAEEWQIFAGAATGLFIAVLLWPIALPLLIFSGLWYGVKSLVKVAGMLKRGEL